MSGVLHQAIARVLRSGAGNAQPDQPIVVGTGVLVSTPQLGPCLLTCAHVVNSAFGWKQTATQAPEDDQFLSFDIPTKGIGEGYTYQARIVVWRPPLVGEERVKHPDCDLALLQLVPGQSLPGDLRLHFPQDFKVLDDDALRGQLLHSFGFDREAGSHMFGKVEGSDASGWLILKGNTAASSFVAPGFSGAPVDDEKTRRFILGLVVSLDSERDRAFLQSTANIQRAILELARPYRGLKVFEEEDAEFFFGRNAFVGQMLEKVQKHPLIGVTGASGVGKSSAIRAGAIPKLRADRSNAILIMRPGDDPWKALAKAFIAQIHTDDDVFEQAHLAGNMATRLRTDFATLRDYAEALLKKEKAERLIIFVDQFEELFTLAGHERPAEDKRTKDASAASKKPDDPPAASKKPVDFRDLMVASATLTGGVPIQWIFSLRGDFVGLAFRSPEFVGLLADGNILLPDMKPAELRLAISGPAEKLKVNFQGRTETQPDLVDRIAQDAGETAGALPLMEHVLELLWQTVASHRTADDEFQYVLTHAAYERLGGLAGALDRHAENVYKKLEAADQVLLPRLFSRLVNVKEDGEATRRITTRAELDELDEELWRLAAKLADEKRRLLVMQSGPEPEKNPPDGALAQATELSNQTVEVAHEALLRNWDRLKEWVRSDRRFLLWRQRLALQIKDHENPDLRGPLLTGGQLEIARSFLQGRDLNKAEEAFIKKSQKEEEALKEKQERLRKMIFIALLAVAVMSIAAAVVGVILWQRQVDATLVAQDEKKRADEQAQRALVNEIQALLALSKTELTEGRPVDAVKLALAAWPRDASDRRPHLLKVPTQVAAPLITYSIPLRTLAHDGPVNGAHLLPDGRILSWSDDRTLRLWDAATGQPAGSPMAHNGPVVGSLVMPSGHILSWTIYTLQLWDPITSRQVGLSMEHEGRVVGVLVMPDGRILSWSDDNTLRLWNATTGQQMGPSMTHEDSVIGARVMPDGSILSWSDDNTLRIWNAATGQQVGPSMTHDNSVLGALVMPDGRILSWSDDNTLRIWNAATGRQEGSPMVHDNSVIGALVMPNGHILSWSSDKTLRQWNATTRQQIGPKMEHDDTVLGALMMPDGYILSWSSDKTLRLWDPATGEQVTPSMMPMMHGASIVGATLVADGRILSWSNDKTLRLWDATTGQQAGSTMKHDASVLGARVMPDGRILSWSADHTLRLWSTATGQQVRPPMKHDDVILGARVVTDGRILSWSADHTLRLWNAVTGQPVSPSLRHEDVVFGARLMPDGRILSWSFDKTLRLWNAATGQQTGAAMKHEDVVLGALVMPDGRILSWSRDNTLRLWNSATGQQAEPSMTHDRSVISALVMPHGRILSWSHDNTLRLWNAATGQQVGPPMTHDDLVVGALVMPAGRILSWSHDKTLRMWDATTGRQVGLSMMHDERVRSALIMPDGRILSWSSDGTLRLWDASTGQQVGPSMRHDRLVSGALVMPDGRILSWSANTLRLWDATTGQESGFRMNHASFVQGARVMGDGRILSWSSDSILRLWDPATGQQLGPPMSHGGLVSGAIKLDDSRILSWSVDQTLRIWDISWPKGNIFEVACALLNPDFDLSSMRSRFELEIEGEICTDPNGIPIPSTPNAAETQQQMN